MGNNKKQISVYLKAGSKAATSYYRFYQYFNRIDADFEYHLMIPDKRWNSFFPIAVQPLWKKIFIFFYIYVRVFVSLLRDIIKKPYCIIISRCLINKVMPYSYKLLILLAKKRGIVIIFDYDDNIISAGEVTRKAFDFYVRISNIVVVGSPILKDLVNNDCREKVVFLPTTDGDIHGLLTGMVTEKRLASFEKEIRIIWVGTFSSLPFIHEIISSIDELGNVLKETGRQLVFTVVCDRPFLYEATSYKLENIVWTREVAIEAMLNAHIGIMPLPDNESTRGKCSFKLIQYLSAGIPVVGSNVGMNKIVLKDNLGVGLSTNNKDEWVSAFLKIISDVDTWMWFSHNAFSDWQTNYNDIDNLQKWKTFLIKV